ncbi:hypothetical protein [Agarivorans sp. 1_MG-2023]|uniref:hypothetical protein n=1 Tax=Agarivorans sp. 1_MG-2023 TaxID=3062634 RepID=UPI0026E32F9F|nr:hypothetical protein [Agarivorans sp. 1_MG-2023]MDO6765392.1 hypothetical protein [Agarivorans sp. 1_MG-2023]
MLNKLVLITVTLFLSACASSPYTYDVEPTPIKKGETQYLLGEVTVKLTLGQGASDDESTFVSEAELNQQFVKSLQQHLTENNLLATDDSVDSIKMNVEIAYLRTFNHGGKALNKPQISHTVTIDGQHGQLATFGKSNYTTKYGGFKDAAVNLEISMFNWDAEDEPKDVDLISRLIVEELSGLGK